MQGAPDDSDRSTCAHAVQLGFHLGQKGSQDIHAGENEFDDLLIDGSPTTANDLQHRLQIVGQAVDGVQLEESGATFERVERSEHRFDRAGVAGVLFEGQHRRLDLLQQAAAFSAEFGQQIGVIDQVQQDRDIQQPRGQHRRRGLRVDPWGGVGTRNGFGDDGLRHSRRRSIGRIAFRLEPQAQNADPTSRAAHRSELNRRLRRVRRPCG